MPDGFKSWLKDARLRLMPFEGELPQTGAEKLSGRKSDAILRPPAPPTAKRSDTKMSSSARFAKFREASRDNILEPRQQIGQILLRYRLITQEQLDEALSVQAAMKVHKLLGEILISLGFLTEMQLISTIAKICQIPFIQLEKYSIDKSALKEIPFSSARRLQLIPLDRLGKMLQIAMANPFDYASIREIEDSSGFTVKRVICTRSALNDAYSLLAPEWESMTLPQVVSASMENVDDTTHGEEARAEAEADTAAAVDSSFAMPEPSGTKEFPSLEIFEGKELEVDWVEDLIKTEREPEPIELSPKTAAVEDSTDEAVQLEKKAPEEVEEPKPEEMIPTPSPEEEKPAAIDAAGPAPAEPAQAVIEEASGLEPVETAPAEAEAPEPAALQVGPEDEDFAYAAEVPPAPVYRDTMPKIDLSGPEPDDFETPAPPAYEPEIKETVEAKPDKGDKPTPLSPEEALAMLMVPGGQVKQAREEPIFDEPLAAAELEKYAGREVKAPAPVREVRPLMAEFISPEQWKIIVPKSANQEFQERVSAHVRRRVMPATAVSDLEFETIAEVL